MATSLTPQPQPSGTTPDHTAPLPPDPALEAALVGLVADGTLTDEQARAVRAARAGAAEAPLERPAGAGTAEPQGSSAPAAPRHNPLPEILGYVGAALVATAVVNSVANWWPDWSATTHLVLVVAGLVVCYAAAFTLAGLSGWREGLATQQAVARRRLVALLLAGGAAFAGLTVLLAPMTTEIGQEPWIVLASGAVAFAAAAAAAWFVRSVLCTLAVAGASVWLAVGLWQVLALPDRAWYLPLGMVLLGVVWTVVAPRLLPVPVLSEALGWAWMVSMTMPYAMWNPGEWDEAMDPNFDALQAQAWTARGILAVLAVVGMLVFLRGGSWPWAAGGITSAVLLALAIGGQTLNWIVATLVAGVVLILLSVMLIALRRRHDSRHSAPPTAAPAT